MNLWGCLEANHLTAEKETRWFYSIRQATTFTGMI